MADVNGDGNRDLYVSAVSYLTMKGHNVLYIHDGDGTFPDRRRSTGSSTWAIPPRPPLRLRRDGDLDMYLLTTRSTPNAVSARVLSAASPARWGPPLQKRRRAFCGCERRAALRWRGGYGLGVVASDLNLDGASTCSSRTIPGERFFLHQQLRRHPPNRSRCRTGTTSRFSMGVTPPISTTTDDRTSSSSTCSHSARRSSRPPPTPRASTSTPETRRATIPSSRVTRCSSIVGEGASRDRVSRWGVRDRLELGTALADSTTTAARTVHHHGSTAGRMTWHISYIGNNAIQASLARGSVRRV